MINTLALVSVLGLPLVAYGGIVTFLLILFTAVIGYLNFKGVSTIPFKWHPRLAVLTILLALIHAFLGLSIFLGY